MRISKLFPAVFVGGLLLSVLPSDASAAGPAPSREQPSRESTGAELAVQLASGRTARASEPVSAEKETAPVVGETSTTRFDVTDDSSQKWRTSVQRIGSTLVITSVSPEGEATEVVMTQDDQGTHIVDGPTPLGTPMRITLSPKPGTKQAQGRHTAGAVTECFANIYEARMTNVPPFGNLVNAWTETFCLGPAASLEHLQSINTINYPSWVSRGSTTYFHSYNPVTYFDSHNYYPCHTGVGAWRQVATVWAANIYGADSESGTTPGTALPCDPYYIQ